MIEDKSIKGFCFCLSQSMEVFAFMFPRTYFDVNVATADHLLVFRFVCCITYLLIGRYIMLCVCSPHWVIPRTVYKKIHLALRCAL